MGALDDGGSTKAKSAAESAGIPTSAPAPSIRESIAAADARAEALSSKLDNPDLSPKQFDKAMTAWLNASNAANELRGQLANSGSGTSTNNYDTSGNNDAGFNAGGPLPSVSITATPPAPILNAPVYTPPPPPIKTATLDIILFDEESIPTDGMFDQIFENIGGQELISITRSDIVNGQKISYQPIKNLSAIQQRYNPNNILSLQQTADKFFAGFSIKLEDKIPEVGNGANGENVYLNASGDLVIEFININADEQIETLISSSGTIYEADLGDYTS